MKKIVLILACAALGFASCSQEEASVAPAIAPDGDAQEISFRLAPATRADMTTANLTEFYVTALTDAGERYFGPEKFSRTTASDGSTVFVSENRYLWPGRETLRFFVHYGPGAAVTVEEGKVYLTKNNTNMQDDWLAATASGNRYDFESAVPLTFKHLFVSFEVQTVNTNANYVCSISTVGVERVYVKGTYSFSDDSWTVDPADAGAVQLSNSTEYTEATSTMTSLPSQTGNLIIPTPLSPWTPATEPTNASKNNYLYYSLKVVTKGGAEVYPYGSTSTWAAIPFVAVLEAGKKYLLRLDFSEGAGYVTPTKGSPAAGDPYQAGDRILDGEIKFTTTVTDWGSTTVTPAM